MTDDQLLQRITMDAAILCGKPVIQGTRLSVEFILNLLAHHMSWDEILKEYPGLSVDDIQACCCLRPKPSDDVPAAMWGLAPPEQLHFGESLEGPRLAEDVDGEKPI